MTKPVSYTGHDPLILKGVPDEDNGRVERVAKAIALERGHASVSALVTNERLWECDGLTYPSTKSAPVWTFYIQTALAAIKAMEEA